VQKASLLYANRYCCKYRALDKYFLHDGPVAVDVVLEGVDRTQEQVEVAVLERDDEGAGQVAGSRSIVPVRNQKAISGQRPAFG
jgi:hypothetical protein